MPKKIDLDCYKGQTWTRNIYITEDGLQMRTELHNERVQNAKRIFASISEDEKQTLLELLEKVTAALQENKEEC
jgi:DNA-binding MarR family transcriptional regulator